MNDNPAPPGVKYIIKRMIVSTNTVRALPDGGGYEVRAWGRFRGEYFTKSELLGMTDTEEITKGEICVLRDMVNEIYRFAAESDGVLLENIRIRQHIEEEEK